MLLLNVICGGVSGDAAPCDVQQTRVFIWLNSK